MEIKASFVFVYTFIQIQTMILKLLTLSSMVGLAAAENCQEFACTGVLSADNGGGASAQTVSKQYALYILLIETSIHIYFF